MLLNFLSQISWQFHSDINRYKDKDKYIKTQKHIKFSE